jgi:hypothetical protein
MWFQISNDAEDSIRLKEFNMPFLPASRAKRGCAPVERETAPRRQLRRHRYLSVVVMLPAGLLVSGCSNRDGRVEIHGTVTLDDKPLDEGLIAFVPAEGETAKAEAVIQNGAYTVQLPPGEKIVQIRGFKTVGHEHAVKGNPQSPLLPIREEIVPPKYNESSELKRTITANSSIEDFALRST